MTMHCRCVEKCGYPASDDTAGHEQDRRELDAGRHALRPKSGGAATILMRRCE